MKFIVQSASTSKNSQVFSPNIFGPNMFSQNVFSQNVFGQNVFTQNQNQNVLKPVGSYPTFS